MHEELQVSVGVWPREGQTRSRTEERPHRIKSALQQHSHKPKEGNSVLQVLLLLTLLLRFSARLPLTDPVCLSRLHLFNSNSCFFLCSYLLSVCVNFTLGLLFYYVHVFVQSNTCIWIYFIEFPSLDSKQMEINDWICSNPVHFSYLHSLLICLIFPINNPSLITSFDGIFDPILSTETFWSTEDRGSSALLFSPPFSSGSRFLRGCFAIVQNGEISPLSQMPLVKWIWLTQIAEDKVSDHKFPARRTRQIWLTSEA